MDKYSAAIEEIRKRRSEQLHASPNPSSKASTGSKTGIGSSGDKYTDAIAQMRKRRELNDLGDRLSALSDYSNDAYNSFTSRFKLEQDEENGGYSYSPANSDTFMSRSRASYYADSFKTKAEAVRKESAELMDIIDRYKDEFDPEEYESLRSSLESNVSSIGNMSDVADVNYSWWGHFKDEDQWNEWRQTEEYRSYDVEGNRAFIDELQRDFNSVKQSAFEAPIVKGDGFGSFNGGNDVASTLKSAKLSSVDASDIVKKYKNYGVESTEDFIDFALPKLNYHEQAKKVQDSDAQAEDPESYINKTLAYDVAGNEEYIEQLKSDADAAANLNNQKNRAANATRQYNTWAKGRGAAALQTDTAATFDPLIQPYLDKYGVSNVGELSALRAEKVQYHDEAKRLQDVKSISDNARSDPAFYDIVEKTRYRADNEATKLTGKRNCDLDDITGDAFIDTGEILGPGSARMIYMSDDQVDMYSYILGTQGIEAANEYFHLIEADLDQVKGKAKADFYIKNNIEGFFVLEAGLDQFVSGMAGAWDALLGKEKYTPPSDSAIASSLIRESLLENEDGTKDDWNLKSVAYDLGTTTVNMLPSILLSKGVGLIASIPAVAASATATGIISTIAPIVGTASMGMSAAGNAYREMINLGYSAESAQGYAFLTGLSESTLEYALGGIESLGGKGVSAIEKALGTSGVGAKASEKIVNGLVNVIKGLDKANAQIAIKYGSKFLGNMASEGIEESLQEILDPVFKAACFGEDIDVDWSEVLYSGVLGSLSAGLLDSASTSVEMSSEISKSNVIRNAMKNEDFVPKVTEYAKTVSEADWAELSSKLAANINENSTAYDILNFLRANEVDMSYRTYEAIYNTLLNFSETPEKGKTKTDARKVASWVSSFVNDTGRAVSAEEINAYAINENLKSALLKVFNVPEKRAAVNLSTWGSVGTDALGAYQSIKGDVNSARTKNDRSDRIFNATTKVYEKSKRGKTEPPVNDITVQSEFETLNKVESEIEKPANQEKYESNEPKFEKFETTADENGKSKLIVKRADGTDAADVSDSALYRNSRDEEIVVTLSAIDGLSASEANDIYGFMQARPDISSTATYDVYEQYMMGYLTTDNDLANYSNVSDKLGEKAIAEARELGHKARGKTDSAKAQAQTTGGPVRTKEGIYDNTSKMVDMTNLSNGQKVQKDYADKLSRVLRLSVHIYDSIKDSSGEIVCATDLVGEDGSVLYKRGTRAPNGFFVSTNGDIFIDINAGADMDGLMVNALSHELVHKIRSTSVAAFNRLADFLVKRLYAEGTSVDELVQIKQQALSDSGAADASIDAAFEDFVCDAMEEMLVSDDVALHLKELYAKDRGLYSTIKRKIEKYYKAFKRMRNMYRNGLVDETSLSGEAQAVRNLSEESYKQIARIYAECLAVVDGRVGNNESKTPKKTVAQAKMEAQKKTGQSIFKAAKEAAKVANEAAVDPAKPEAKSLDQIKGNALGAAPANEYTATLSGIKNSIRTRSGFDPKIVYTVAKDPSSHALTSTEAVQRFGEIAENKARSANGTDTFTGADITEMVMVKNSKGGKVAHLNQFMDTMADYMNEAGVEFQFIGLDDVNNAKLVFKRGANGEVTAAVLSAMVKNGEYPVNFDLTTVCKQREAMSKLFDKLSKRGSLDGDVELSPENIFEINKMLRDLGYETACLGCFVESKRYNIQEWAESFCHKWNTAAKDVDPDVGYYNFASKDVKLADMSMDELAQAYSRIEKYKADKRKLGKGNVNDVTAFVRNLGDKLGLIKPSDLMTRDGLQQLLKIPEFSGVIMGHYGSATPKLMQGFTPYNSEIALLPDTVGARQSLSDYLYSIAGARLQSFSDFQVKNVYDYLQIVSDLAARDLPAHAYTKVLSFAKIFGMTGIKTNLSVMFDIDPKAGKSHAGLTKYDPGIHKGEYAKTVLEDAEGKWVYNVGDYATRKAYKKADPASETRFVQSIGFEDAVNLQTTEGYTSNVGIIGVGYSDAHMEAMLNDDRIRYVIGYHKSSLPSFVQKASNIGLATDYTGIQNNTTITQITKDGKSVDYDLAQRYAELGNGRDVIAELLDHVKNDGWKVRTEKAEGGHGDFELYETLRSKSSEADPPRSTANEYIDWCVENGKLPVFYTFAAHDNYYKLVYDFNVYDNVTGEYAPQEAVRNAYPALDTSDNVVSSEADADGFDASYLKDLIDGEMSLQNSILENLDSDLDHVAEQIEDRFAGSLEERTEAIRKKAASKAASRSDVKTQLRQIGGETKSTKRELLAEALDKLAEKGADKKIINKYRSEIDEANEAEAELDDINAELHEICFKKGKRDVAREKKLIGRKTELLETLESIDLSLLRFEKMEPVKKAIDSKILAEKKELRDQTKAEIRRIVNENRTKLIERQKERQKAELLKRRDNAEKKAIRERIKKTVGRFNSMLKNPSEKKHVPKELVKEAVEILNCINMEGPRMQEKRLSEIANIKKMYEAYRGDPDFPIYDDVVADMIQTLQETVGDTPIGKLNKNQLETVDSTLNALVHSAKAKTDAGMFERNKTVAEVNRALKEEVRQSTTKRFRFTKDLLNPKNMFLALAGWHTGSTMEKVYAASNEAQLKETAVVLEMTDPFLKFLDDAKYVETLSDQKSLVDIGLKDKNGEAIPVTRGIMLGIYMNLFNEDNLRHIEIGGITVPNISDYYGKSKDPYGYNKKAAVGVAREMGYLRNKIRNAQSKSEAASDPAEIAALKDQLKALETEKKRLEETGHDATTQMRNKIESLLTDKDRELLSAARNFFDEVSKDKINEVTLRRYGIKKAREENYCPIKTDKNYVKGSRYDVAAADASPDNMGILKDRVGSEIPIMAIDILELITGHIRDVSKYYGLSEFVDTFNSVFGRTSYTDTTSESKPAESSLMSAIEEKYGTRASRMIDNYITDLFGMSRNIRGEDSRWVARLRNNVASAYLSITPKNMLQQFVGYFQSVPVLGWRNTIAGITRAAENPMFRSEKEALIYKWTPLYRYRRDGGMSNIVNDIKKNNIGLLGGKVKLKIPRWIFSGLEFVDGLTVGGLWAVSEIYVERNFKNLEKGSDAYYMKVAEMFNKAIEETQPNSTVAQKAAILRNPNEVVKFATQFQGQNSQNYNLVYRDVALLRQGIKDYKSGRITKTTVKALRKNLVRSGTSLIVTSAMMSALGFAAKWLLRDLAGYEDDDDELTVKSVLEKIGIDSVETLAGTILYGSDVVNLAEAIFGDGQFYGIDDGAFAQIDDALADLVSLIDAAASEKSDPKKIAKKTRELAASLGNACGIPAESTYEALRAVLGWTGELISALVDDDVDFDGELEDLFFPEEKSKKKRGSK